MTASARPGDLRNITLYYYDLTKKNAINAFFRVCVWVYLCVFSTRELSRTLLECVLRHPRLSMEALESGAALSVRSNQRCSCAVLALGILVPDRGLSLGRSSERAVS